MENSGDPFVLEETLTRPVAIHSHGVLYEDPFKKIERITAKFEGFSKEYFVSDCGEKAAVMVVRNNHILLVRQYRLFVDGLSFEIPAGRVNDDESPAQAARRECFEETGVTCRNLQPLIDYDVDLECVKNHTYVFLSADSDAPDPKLSQSHVWLPIKECLDMVCQGRISDSMSIISILGYHAKVVAR